MQEQKPTVPLLGYMEIAEAIGQDVSLIRVWKNRGKLPNPDFQLGQSPGWLAETINPWIQEHRQ